MTADLRMLTAFVVLAVLASTAACSVNRPDKPTTPRSALGAEMDCSSDYGEVDSASMGLSSRELVATADCDLGVDRQAKLDDELLRARRAILPYPTVADALAGGFALKEEPGQDDDGPVHMYRVDRIDERFDVDEPEMLLYAGTEPEAPLLTSVYWVPDAALVAPPKGFTGPADRWHFHTNPRNACVFEDRVDDDTSLTAEACQAAGGRLIVGSGWMLHVWVVPTHPNPRGVFAAGNPEVPGT